MTNNRVERDEEDLVRLYLTDIGQYELLDKEDEVRLAKRIEEGVAAREALDKNNGADLTPAKDESYAEHLLKVNVPHQSSLTQICD